jgi:hypothetical protein
MGWSRAHAAERAVAAGEAADHHGAVEMLAGPFAAERRS